MRTDEQFRKDVFERANRFNVQRARTRKRIMASAVPFALVFAVALFVFPNFSDRTAVNNDKSTTITTEAPTVINYGFATSKDSDKSTEYILDDGVIEILFDDYFLQYKDAVIVDEILNNVAFTDKVKNFDDAIKITLGKADKENLYHYEYSEKTGLLRLNTNKYATLNEEQQKQMKRIIEKLYGTGE